MTVGVFHPLNYLYAMILWALIFTGWHTFGRERYAGEFDNVPATTRYWFRNVHSPNGVPCCDIADGHRTSWRHGEAGYEVPIENVWIPVPPEAVVYNAGNPIDEAVVWYVRQGSYTDEQGEHPAYYIRCFVPGDGV